MFAVCARMQIPVMVSEHMYINRYFYGVKFEKLGNPDVAFPERLHETKHQVNFQESAEWDKSKIHTKTR